MPKRCAIQESVGRAMNWDIEAPNVVTEARFRELVERGYSAEILCQETAHQKGPSYYGVWIMRVVSDEGVEKLLVTARTRTTYNDIKIREFKTISGVVSFFLGLGFAHVDLPLMAGTSRSHKLAPSGKTPSDKTPSDKGAGS
jgi:hypothetical protein